MKLWTPNDIPEYITPEEAQAMIDACPRLRDKYILRTMWETGGRISEVLSLKPEMLDTINNCIILTNLKQHKKDGKTPLKRVFLFPESTLVKELIVYSKERSIPAHSWIFQGKSKDGRISPVTIWYLLANCEYGRKLGLAAELGIRKIKNDNLRPVWPHLFRHGAAMNMYHRTGRLDVVQKQLGHRSIVTTEIYAQLTDEDRQILIQVQNSDKASETIDS